MTGMVAVIGPDSIEKMRAPLSSKRVTAIGHGEIMRDCGLIKRIAPEIPDCDFPEARVGPGRVRDRRRRKKKAAKRRHSPLAAFRIRFDCSLMAPRSICIGDAMMAAKRSCMNLNLPQCPSLRNVTRRAGC
ncbi:hypothetical protein [Sphingomonas sp.]|uniref:hypothetical protein n=1 Tax=Sphingomonas sp. TaxID=28214 RepID=UPI003CC5ED6D